MGASVLIRIPLLAALCVALDVLLARARDPEGAGGYVLGDHRSGGRVCVVADRHRSDERRVDARLDSRADRRAVLAGAVVVGRDRARAQVRVLADGGIADVGEIGYLRPRT